MGPVLLALCTAAAARPKKGLATKRTTLPYARAARKQGELKNPRYAFIPYDRGYLSRAVLRNPGAPWIDTNEASIEAFHAICNARLRDLSDLEQWRERTPHEKKV